jgi:hypothetical protein
MLGRDNSTSVSAEFACSFELNPGCPKHDLPTAGAGYPVYLLANRKAHFAAHWYNSLDLRPLEMSTLC